MVRAVTFLPLKEERELLKLCIPLFVGSEGVDPCILAINQFEKNNNNHTVPGDISQSDGS